MGVGGTGSLLTLGFLAVVAWPMPAEAQAPPEGCVACHLEIGDDLFDHYRHMLESLGNEKGLLGLINYVNSHDVAFRHPLAVTNCSPRRGSPGSAKYRTE